MIYYAQPLTGRTIRGPFGPVMVGRKGHKRPAYEYHVHNKPYHPRYYKIVYMTEPDVYKVCEKYFRRNKVMIVEVLEVEENANSDYVLVRLSDGQEVWVDVSYTPLDMLVGLELDEVI